MPTELFLTSGTMAREFVGRTIEILAVGAWLGCVYMASIHTASAPLKRGRELRGGGYILSASCWTIGTKHVRGKHVQAFFAYVPSAMSESAANEIGGRGNLPVTLGAEPKAH